MKASVVRKSASTFISVFVLIFSATTVFAQQKTPYPIIFVHGICSDNQTWGAQDGKFDNIIDYLEGAGLKYGGNLNFSLNYKRDSIHFNTTREQDVHWYESNANSGDFYTINFNVRATPRVTTIDAQATIGALPISNNLITPSTNQIPVSQISQFLVDDIIRIGDEFMQVTSINGNSILVKRHISGSQSLYHTSGDNIYNLSNESNQASIVKQGYALKIAIEAIMLATNAKKVVLVGHSMGGLAAREYLRSYGNDKVAKIVTIGTPHYGSNIFGLSNSALNIFLPGLDVRSDAARDLSTNINNHLGQYLYGGNENDIKGFYSADLNVNGLETDAIEGLNDYRGYHALDNIAHTWIASSYLGSGNDIAVLTKSQYISINDTLMTNKRHDQETGDYYSLLRGLDEPGNPSLAYEIDPNSSIKGFITFGQGNSKLEENPIDYDLYKISIDKHATLAINILASVYTEINTVSLLNADQTVRKSIAHITINNSISDDLEAGTYYIQIYGTATHGDHPSYQYPYTLTTKTTTIPPAQLTILPASISFYDLVLNQSLGKSLTLTNNGSTPISVSNLTVSGTNADQFSIIGPTSYTIDGGKTQTVTVTFNPTSTGPKKALLKITNSSLDNPLASVSLEGNGATTPTKKLEILPYNTYNFGNETITLNNAKAFNVLNKGSEKVTISNMTFIGPNADQFFVSTQSVLPFDISPNGGESTFIVNFRPSSIGSKNAQLVIKNDADDKSLNYAISLYGNGTNDIYSGVAGKIVAYEYWFDDNYNSKVFKSFNPQSLSYLDTNFPTNALVTGSHFLHVRYQDQKGIWSAVITNNFYKTPLAPDSERTIVAYEYWFDNNYMAKTSVVVTPAHIAALNGDITSGALPVGSHNINIRYKDDIGQWSSVISCAIYKTKPVSGTNLITSYRYWFDTDNQHTTTVSLQPPVNPLTLSTNLNGSTLAKGNHTVHLQFKDTYNSWSAVTNDTAYFQTVTPPTITSFTPINGSLGNTITITGTNFTGATAVSFGGTAATSFTVVSPTSITAILGSGSSGNLSVTTPDGTVSQSGFTYNPSQTIIFSALPLKIYGASDFDAGATSISGLTINYSSSNASVATIVLGKIHIVGAGTTTISATDGNKTVTQLLTINPTPLTISANNQTKVYGLPVPNLTVSYSGFVNGDTPSNLTTQPSIVTTATPISGVGDYPINVSGALSRNYLFTYVPGSLTISPAPAPPIIFSSLPSIIYGSADIAITAISTNTTAPITFLSSNTSVATITSGGAIHVTGAGSAIITASQIASPNYGPGTPVNQTLTVTPAVLTVNANNQTKTYGAVNPVLTLAYNGFINGDVPSTLSTQPTAATTCTTTSAVDTYPITVSAGSSPNYTFSYLPGTLTVTPAPLSIIADNKSKNYSDDNPLLTISYSGFVNGDTQTTLSTPAMVATAATTLSTVGAYPIIASGATSTNYSISFISGTLTVNPAPSPTISIISPNVGVIGTTITLTGTYLLNTTSVSFGGNPAASFTINSSTSITAVVGGGSSGNVTVSTTSGTGIFPGFNFVYNLPPSNFKMSITSSTCKGSNNGAINITAVQALNYTATISGGGVNNSYPFTSSQDIKNLAAGTYSICIAVAGQPDYKQCFDVVITEPKDLSLYSTINSSINSITLALGGGTQYNIQLNDVLYTTSNSTITLPLKEGNNKLAVSTDKLCQGIIEKVINVSGSMVPYPDPFQNTLNLNLGNERISNVSVEIHNVSDGKLVFFKQYVNQAGVLQLDLSNFNNGVYALHLSMDRSEKIFKIMKR